MIHHLLNDEAVKATLHMDGQHISLIPTGSEDKQTGKAGQAQDAI